MMKQSLDAAPGTEMRLPVISIGQGLGLEDTVVRKLLQKQWNLTTAESCTGGLLAGRIVNVPGVSDVFDRGFVTYSNQAKEEELHVQAETLKRYGAVSAQTVVEMAKGAAEHAGTKAAVAVTGLAGPDGGTPQKPVGLVYVGIALPGEVYWQEYHFKGTREEVRQLTVSNALSLLLSLLQNE